MLWLMDLVSSFDRVFDLMPYLIFISRLFKGRFCLHRWTLSLV